MTLCRRDAVLFGVNPHPQQLGDFGERLAERWVIRSGWQVIARQFRIGHRDIDLIAKRANTIAFIEVKTRRRTDFGGPIAAVSAQKRRHLTHAAAIWTDRHGEPGWEYRFDVIGVLVGGGLIRIAHVENAFTAWEGRPRR